MNGKRVWVMTAIIMAMLVQTVGAGEYTLFGKPLTNTGFLSQGGAYSLINRKGDYDTVTGLQSLPMTFFTDITYLPSDNLKLYTSGKLTADLAYQANHDRDAWNEKLFSKSRSGLGVDDHYWQILHEAHLTWQDGKSFLRVGKQIVGWGQTDGFRLMDQINPQDNRRGPADVQFETTIIPIWLVRAEYYKPTMSDWLQEIGGQIIFNPNVDGVRTQSLQLGNEEAGIWAPKAVPPFPAYVGQSILNIDKVNNFSPQGFEYGGKLEAMVHDSVVTLNGYYGREKEAILRSGGLPSLGGVAPDGKPILNMKYEGYYPLFRFVGTTFTRQVPFLKIPINGSPAPVVRIEALYAFGSTFVDKDVNEYHKSDELRYAIGVDWKLNIPFLNPKGMISIMPQFYERRIMDYPRGSQLVTSNYTDVRAVNYQTSLFVSTSYLNAKLTPSIFWLRDVTYKNDFFKFQVAYNHNYNWRYAIGAMIFGGGTKNESFRFFENKDQLYFRVEYRWQ
jgi:hypothetical protein